MKKIWEKLNNLYCLLGCACAIGWRCIVVVSRARFGSITQDDMSESVRGAAIKVLEFSKTSYKVSFVTPLKLDPKTYYIFMSNHESLMDIPLIFANVTGTVRCLIKKELTHIPFFGKTLLLSGCIPVDRSKRSTTNFYEQVKDLLNKNVALWIFPEGTRSKTTDLLTFKPGGFRFAQQMSAKIIPVGLYNTRAVLPPKSFSFRFHQKTQLNFGEPIDTTPYESAEDQKILIEKVRLAIEDLRKPR